jgi:hypothetical protein
MRCHLGIQEGTQNVVTQAKLNSWHMTWDKTSWQCQLRSKMGVKWLERTLINNFHLHFGLLCIQRLWYFLDQRAFKLCLWFVQRQMVMANQVAVVVFSLGFVYPWIRLLCLTSGPLPGVQGSKKFLSVFGGHLTFMNITPRKKGEALGGDC